MRGLKSMAGVSRGRWRHVWLLVSVVFVCACSPEEPVPQQTPDHASTPHSDHTPKFGGLVLMERDIHFEVVARPTGYYRVYFSDERRNPLPASMVTDLVVTIMRPEQDAEEVPLQRDVSDQSWIGESRPVESDDTMVRVSYVYRDQPYWIDLPFVGFTQSGTPTGPPPGAP